MILIVSVSFESIYAMPDGFFNNRPFGSRSYSQRHVMRDAVVNETNETVLHQSAVYFQRHGAARGMPEDCDFIRA
jgi:hypothetical protein